MITATLTCLGKKYTAKGHTVGQAIGNLKPGNVALKGILVCSNGKEERERVINHVLLKRLFNLNPQLRERAIEQVSLLFNL